MGARFKLRSARKPVVLVVDDDARVREVLHAILDGEYQVADAADGGEAVKAVRARPELQRFLSEDPLSLDGGLNVFAFVSNNPLRYIDPLGLKALICSRPLRGAGPAFGRHSFIVTDDTTTPAGTLSLFPQSGVGVPTERGFEQGDDPNRPDARCKECRPKGKCGDVSECLKKASQQYPATPMPLDLRANAVQMASREALG